MVWAVRSRLDRPGTFSNRTAPFVFREDAVLWAMLAYLGSAMLLSGVMKSIEGSSDQVLVSLVVNNGAQLCGVGACLALAARRVPGGVRSFLLGEHSSATEPWQSVWPETMGLIVVALGVCPFIRDVTAWLILWIVPGYQFEVHPTLQALDEGGISGAKIVSLWIGAAVIAPVAEEMFFRGILQNFVSRATKKTSLAIAFAAAAFATIHFSQPYAVPALFFLGVLLGAAYFRSGKLVVPIVIHAAFNFKTLVWETLERQWS